jgi:hypothetical protein
MNVYGPMPVHFHCIEDRLLSLDARRPIYSVLTYRFNLNLRFDTTGNPGVAIPSRQFQEFMND